MPRLAPPIALAAAALLLLSACSVTATSYIVSGADIATTAEDALEAEVGSRPVVDCGTEDIPLVEGTVVDCILTDPATGDQYDAPVTIEAVDGPEYRIGVSVGAQPIN